MKVLKIVGVWAAIMVAYIVMAATMLATNALIVTANTSLVAAANMSNFPGTQPAVETASVWLWFIPGGVGAVYTVWELKFKKD